MFIKKCFLLSLVGIFMISCNTVGTGNFNEGYLVGIIEFSKSKRVSYINQYSDEGRLINKVKLSVEGVRHFNDIVPSDDEKFYLKSTAALSKGTPENYLIEIDKNTNRYSKVDLNLEDVYDIGVDEENVYIAHSINKLSVYDKRLNKITNTVKMGDYVSHEFYLDEEKIYIFTREGTSKSYLNIVDKKSFNIDKSIDVTHLGLYQNDIYFDDGRLYFTNYDVFSSQDLGKLGIYDINKGKLSYINVSAKNLDKLVVYGDYFYITLVGEKNNLNSDTVIIINRTNLSYKKVDLGYDIKVFDLAEDKIFILSDEKLEIYNAKDFSLYKEIKLKLKKDSVLSGLFVY